MVAVIVGAVSFGFAGFAFALFASAGLALAWPPAIVVPTVMLVADTLTLPLLWEHRRYLRRDLLRESPPFAPWSPALLLLGVMAGALLLGRVSPAVARLGLASVILAFVTTQVKRSELPGASPGSGAWPGRVAALAAGFLDGWISTGGVVIAVYLTWRRMAPGLFVAAILVYFLSTDAIRVVIYALFGYWTSAVFTLYRAVLPMALLGYLGGVVLRRSMLPPGAFRGVVLALLTVYALALLARVLLAP
jgi:hypothetical protein